MRQSSQTDAELQLQARSQLVLLFHTQGLTISDKSYPVTALPKAATSIPLSRGTIQIQWKSVGNSQLASWTLCVTSASWGQANIEHTSVTCVWEVLSGPMLQVLQIQHPRGMHANSCGLEYASGSSWLRCFLSPCAENTNPFLNISVHTGPVLSGQVSMCLCLQPCTTVALFCGRWTVMVGEGYHVCTVFIFGRHGKGGVNASYYIKPWNKRCTGERCSGVLAGRSCQLMEELPNWDNKNASDYKLKLCNSCVL